MMPGRGQDEAFGGGLAPPHLPLPPARASVVLGIPTSGNLQDFYQEACRYLIDSALLLAEVRGPILVTPRLVRGVSCPPWPRPAQHQASSLEGGVPPHGNPELVRS